MPLFHKRTSERHHLEDERQLLASSVEEMIAEGNAALDEGDEEDLRSTGRHPSLKKRPTIIQPRLSLQSHSLPVVRLTQSPSSPSDIPPSISSSLESAAINAANMPTAAPPVEVARPIQRTPRLAGRSTRVRLQAVQTEQEVTTERVIAVDKRVVLPPYRDMQPAQAQEQASLPAASETRSDMPALRWTSGRGLLTKGQSELFVPAPMISESSVVTVMLAGNPGPVVVQYILLHPQQGFTVYVSAPVVASTPFNYVIWLC